jgi:hypothetical protein
MYGMSGTFADIPDPKALVREIVEAFKQTDVYKWAEQAMVKEQMTGRFTDRQADYETELPPEMDQEDDWAEPGEDASYYHPDEEEGGGEYLDPNYQAGGRRALERFEQEQARRPRIRG